MDKIAVLIPCYNESQTIKKVVEDWKKELPEAQFMCTTTILRITRLQSQEKPELLFVMNISRERET